MRSGVASKVVGRLVVEVFQDVASLDQCHALGGEAFQFDRADFGAILVPLAALLRLFVAVEFALDALTLLGPPRMGMVRVSLFSMDRMGPRAGVMTT
jgi:hypothetical protein